MIITLASIIKTMKLVVRASEKQKKEVLEVITEMNSITFVTGFTERDEIKDADAFLDLMFEDDPSTLHDLKRLLPKLIIINSVAKTLQETDKNFIRINAWAGFFNKTLLEGSYLEQNYKTKAEVILGALSKKIQWVPDEPGFISARVVSMIINEAYLAFHEGVSTKDEIDAAMKSGTSYPFGPFEWAEKIGVDKIKNLLLSLEKYKKK